MRRVHPDYPPRTRLERVIASARIVIALGAAVAVWFDPTSPAFDPILTAYLVHSLFVLGLVWSPVRFGRTWSLAVHAGDLLVVALMMFVQGPNSPFFIYFMFCVVSGALRWNLPGALWTAVGALSLYAGISVAIGSGAVLSDQFIIRCVQLTVVAAMVGYLTAYYSRIQQEVVSMAAWPRRMPGEVSDVVEEVLERVIDILPVRRVLLIWEEPDEGTVNIASREGDHVEWLREPPGTYLPFVLEAFDAHNFQALDAADPRGPIRLWARGRFRERRGVSVNEALRARFDMRAIQSCRVEGDIVRGRLFWMYQRKMGIDDLVVGELVALLAAARLDGVYFLERLRESAGLRERVRVARELHDSILQTLAGLALQLAVARRLSGGDSGTAQRLEDIQRQFEGVEIEMRSFIRRLRPVPKDASLPAAERLEIRCEALQRHVETHWGVLVDMQLSVAEREMPADLVRQLFLIIQEAVLNAARHANASNIRVNVHVLDEELRVEVSDDGKGFPFAGSYDLAALNAMGTGPLTLKERVAELHGSLRLDSSRAGARVMVTLPLAQAT